MGDGDVPAHHNYFDKLVEQIEDFVGGLFSLVEIHRSKDGWQVTAYRFGGVATEIATDAAEKIIDFVREHTSLMNRMVIDRNLGEIEAV